NQYGQIGSSSVPAGSGDHSAVPVQVTGLGGVTAIAGGGNHSMALKSDGTVWTWGWDSFLQLGASGGSALSDGGTVPLGKPDKGGGSGGGGGGTPTPTPTTGLRSTPGQVGGLSGVGAID